MNARYASDWEQIHFDSTLVDLHAHPSLNVSLFHRTLLSRLCPSSRAFDPFSSDFDGFTDPPDDLKDASQLPRLTQRSLVAGYSPEDIQKILGGNALRVLMEGWKEGIRCGRWSRYVPPGAYETT